MLPKCAVATTVKQKRHKMSPTFIREDPRTETAKCAITITKILTLTDTVTLAMAKMRKDQIEKWILRVTHQLFQEQEGNNIPRHINPLRRWTATTISNSISSRSWIIKSHSKIVREGAEAKEWAPRILSSRHNRITTWRKIINFLTSEIKIFNKGTIMIRMGKFNISQKTNMVQAPEDPSQINLPSPNHQTPICKVLLPAVKRESSTIMVPPWPKDTSKIVTHPCNFVQVHKTPHPARRRSSKSQAKGTSHSSSTCLVINQTRATIRAIIQVRIEAFKRFHPGKCWVQDQGKRHFIWTIINSSKWWKILRVDTSLEKHLAKELLA